MKKILCVASTLFFLTTGMAIGGYVTPELDTWMSRVADDEYVSTVVMLSDQVDIAALNSELNEMQATRAYRHETVVRALMEKAQEAQGGVIALLEQGLAEGRVKDYKSLWIANVLTVEAKRDFIEELAARADVSDMYLDFEIENIDPVAKREASEQTIASIEEGLERINAPLAWARGYTGAGRLVSNLDTGVDGNHPALASRWRGLTEPYQECWYDPVTFTTFPFDSWGHGTHTMGTQCGYQVNTDDHVGVAYDAKWIAAGVIDRVDIPTTIADAIDAFQWTSDPDGNPGTLDDVPDVSSNSWGISPIYHGSYLPGGACDQMFWSVLDACEAAGVVVVFAAGNEGNSAPYSVRNPANRAVDPYNSFCVGAIDGANYGSDPIAYFSSWGPVPADCGSQTMKPEVAAPGYNVRSSYPGGGYTYMSGTSMACPHVAGAVAVLRQADPNATSEEVKFALMSTAQDLGTPGEDNGYGHGLIDLNAALDVLGASGCWWEFSCAPENPPIIIPETGGSFSWGGFLTNHCDSVRRTDIWTMARLPGGYVYGPVLHAENVRFGPDQMRSASGITHYVPGGAPQGSYKYKVYFGEYPSAPKDSCIFNVYKQGGGGGGPYNVLILLSDYGTSEASVAQDAVLNDPEGRFLSCDAMDVYSTTPTIDQLLPYDVVMAWSNYPFADANLLGDVLADYVDVGGSVLLSEFSFFNGWALGGRLMYEYYSPLGVGNTAYSPVSLGTYNPGHPIMQGVTTLSDGAYSTNPPVQGGAEVVASWDNGTPCVAVSGLTPRVVALNMAFGASYQQLGGDYALLLPNALAYAGDNGGMRTMGWDTNEFFVQDEPGKTISEKHSSAPVTSITAVENGMRGEETR